MAAGEAAVSPGDELSDEAWRVLIHDFRNLLPVIVNYSDLIADKTADAAAVEARPDIILLDLMLGDTTGDQILIEIRNDFRTRLIPIVFLTVRGSLKDKVEHLLAGADDYVTKPFIPEELVARLRAVMNRSTTTRDLNPLTGMSGNSDILRAMGPRLRTGERFPGRSPAI